jgi:hypothetical protein
MKIGLIVECTKQGLERVVCPVILRLLSAEVRVPIEPTFKTMTNKKLLIRDAAETTRLLLDEGCDRVVIMWDENPPWTPEKDIAEDRCWHIEREQILKDLGREKIHLHGIALVCIEHEFETWLLHDLQLLRAVISRAAHPAKVKSLPDPMRIDDPKAALMALFRKHKTSYNPDVAARRFAKCLGGLDQLKRCDTFRYFAQSVLGRMPKDWKPYVYHPKGPKKMSFARPAASAFWTMASSRSLFRNWSRRRSGTCTPAFARAA